MRFGLKELLLLSILKKDFVLGRHDREQCRRLLRSACRRRRSKAIVLCGSHAREETRVYEENKKRLQEEGFILRSDKQTARRRA